MPAASRSSISPFKKILVANRGEIAVRIFRACHEMEIASVAVYSEADDKALHTRMADQAVLIGPPAPRESYLNIEKIIQAALESGAEAIHPGYGFLSENADFAQAVLDAGLVFIGPSPEAIRAMGDKAGARALMDKAEVPLVPGYQAGDDDKSLAKAAKEIGFPVLIKAAAGGGGKGMRVVQQAGGLAEGIAAARREAQHAFGDQRLILEKYVTQARHIEFQILADQHGNLLHLFERECSIQRRHQKVIEETPSPLLDAVLRAEMGEAAAAAAKAVDYTNAGTVEFIVDPQTRQFYFLEMNTRLQVEHPITELTTGLDLTQWQIRIAAGEKLPFTQADVHMHGHAIEARLYAEDPANGFLPATGTLYRWQPPEGPGMRLDSGVTAGSEVSVYYDPLLAKVIVFGEERQAAIRKLKAALCQTVILGVTTNREFLLDILDQEEFKAGKATTHFIEDHYTDWSAAKTGQVPVEALAAAALAEMFGAAAPQTKTENGGSDPFTPWNGADGFRMGGSR